MAMDRAGRFAEAIDILAESLKLSPDTDVARRRDTLIETHGFKFTGVEVDADSDRPQFCLQFRGDLIEGPRVRYGDYLRVDPPIKGRIVAHADRLCLDGVRHGDSHNVTILAGLPAADGSTTPWPETVSVEIGDRSPSVAFAGNTYVLPRTGSAGCRW